MHKEDACILLVIVLRKLNSTITQRHLLFARWKIKIEQSYYNCVHKHGKVIMVKQKRINSLTDRAET